MAAPDPFRHRIRVRYVECDAQGVVFNVHYFTYFDVAMTEFHRAHLGPYRDLVDDGAEMVVAEARARYFASAAFDEELDVEVFPSRLGNTSLTMRFLVTRNGERLVEGELRYVFVHASEKTKCPIPDGIRAALEPLLVA